MLRRSQSVRDVGHGRSGDRHDLPTVQESWQVEYDKEVNISVSAASAQISGILTPPIGKMWTDIPF